MTTRWFDSSKGYQIIPRPLDGEEYVREADVPFHFDPSHDYTKDVDQFTPQYTPPQYRTVEWKPGAALTTPEDQRGTRNVRINGRETRTMPFQRYVRGVDLQGNIHPVTTSTCRPTPEYPNGDDGLGTASRAMEGKEKSGWLILELGKAAYGRRGQEYLAWALAVAEKRRLAHAKYEQNEEAAFMSIYQRKMLEFEKQRSASQAEMTDTLVKTVVEAVMAAQAAMNQGKAKGRAE